MVGPMARPGPAGSGLKFEIVLRAGPGHNGCGPGLIIQFAGRAEPPRTGTEAFATGEETQSDARTIGYDSQCKLKTFTEV